jgi:hypothetical protein
MLVLSVTSRVIGSTGRPSSWSALAAAAVRTASRPARKVRTPAWASWRTVSVPMPRVAPVTSAILSEVAMEFLDVMGGTRTSVWPMPARLVRGRHPLRHTRSHGPVTGFVKRPARASPPLDQSVASMATARPAGACNGLGGTLSAAM